MDFLNEKSDFAAVLSGLLLRFLHGILEQPRSLDQP
jgi:hypothetical protein